MDTPKVYGWPVSPYTVKVFSYLTYKQLTPKLIHTNLWQMTFKIKKDVGQNIMPVVYDAPYVLQDSSAIIDHYESQYPQKSVIPDEPLHKISAYILEIMGDEWLILAALHFRWNYPENHSYIYEEFGKYAIPKWPKLIQRQVGKLIGQRISGYLPLLGINESMQGSLENNTQSILEALNTHLSQHAFLFGSRPSLADFSLFGPIQAHLYRDPFPSKLLTPYSSIRAWLKKLNGPIEFTNGEWIQSSSLPSTLLPLFQIWCDSHLPIIKASIVAFSNWCIQHPTETKLPRSFGHITLTIEGTSSKRLNLSYVLWIWQRLQRVYSTLSDEEKINIDTLLNQLDILHLVQTPLPRTLVLKQCRLHVVPC